MLKIDKILRSLCKQRFSRICLRNQTISGLYTILLFLDHTKVDHTIHKNVIWYGRVWSNREENSFRYWYDTVCNQSITPRSSTKMIYDSAYNVTLAYKWMLFWWIYSIYKRSICLRKTCAYNQFFTVFIDKD